MEEKMNKYPILNERVYLCSPSINVCFRVIIDELFDKSIIEEALKNVCLRNPLLKCSVEIDNDNNAWLVQKDGSVNIEYYKFNEMDWQTWYKMTDNIPFDLSKEPLIKFCIIIGEHTEIIILGHHIIGDGIGYLNLVKDILLALDNRIDITPQIPPFKPADKEFKKTVPLGILIKMFAKKLNKKWRKSRVRFSENDYLELFKRYRAKYSPSLYMALIEGDGVQTILKKAKSNCLTVNEIIASAFSISVMETLNYRKTCLGLAANIRNELVSEPNSCMGNYVTGISAKIHYNPSSGFIVNAKRIAGTMKKKLENMKSRHLLVHFLNEFDKDLIESLVFAAYGNFDHPVSKKLAEAIGERTEDKNIGISNLGRHDFCSYENFKVINIQFIGPAFPANLLKVDVVTVDSKMNLCFRYNEGEINENVVKAICERTIEYLT
jgi:hypothetical protein